jgi:CheY-like chemotaxis protein
MTALEGVRVLVVEDEFLVATLIEDMLTSAGCVVSGPIPRLAEALDAVDRGTFDAAVLDVNLGGDRVYSVADALSRQRSRWPSCSTPCRASSHLPALRRESHRQPSARNGPRRNRTELQEKPGELIYKGVRLPWFGLLLPALIERRTCSPYRAEV